MKAMYVVIAIVVLAVVAGVTVSQIANSVEQPILFNHQLHLEEAGLECTDCHRYAIDGIRATIPNVDVCGDCHEEPLTESAEEALVAEHVRDGVPIPWRKVYWVPEHVYFSHRRHTAIAGILCETCHGPVGDESVPLTRPLVRIDMNNCMGCHAEAGVTNDCVACHR
jgi:hypothetical protein